MEFTSLEILTTESPGRGSEKLQTAEFQNSQGCYAEKPYLDSPPPKSKELPKSPKFGPRLQQAGLPAQGIPCSQASLMCPRAPEALLGADSSPGIFVKVIPPYVYTCVHTHVHMYTCTQMCVEVREQFWVLFPRKASTNSFTT